MRILVICLGIFALYLPAAALVHRDYVPPPKPQGEVVETLLTLHHDAPDRYFARSNTFLPSRYPEASDFDVYENLTRLSRDGIQLTIDSGAYVVRFKTSDGSDARTNGRVYWLVYGAGRGPICVTIPCNSSAVSERQKKPGADFSGRAS